MSWVRRPHRYGVGFGHELVPADTADMDDMDDMDRAALNESLAVSIDQMRKVSSSTATRSLARLRARR